MNFLVSTFLSMILSFISTVDTITDGGGEEIREIPELTVENVKMELKRQGVQHPDVVLRQAILETGWFKCDHCSLAYNNIFGFYYKGKYLSFDNWTESIAYYKNWQDQLYDGGDYYDFLTRIGYASNPKYISLLQQLKGLY